MLLELFNFMEIVQRKIGDGAMLRIKLAAYTSEISFLVLRVDWPDDIHYQMEIGRGDLIEIGRETGALDYIADRFVDEARQGRQRELEKR